MNRIPEMILIIVIIQIISYITSLFINWTNIYNVFGLISFWCSGLVVGLVVGEHLTRGD